MIRLLLLAGATITWLLAPPARAQDQGPAIEGAWHAQTYTMKGGDHHPVSGHIFFTDNQWTVLFFVHDASGEIKRGSGEGGGYTLTGDRLVLTHRYNLSAGEAMEALPESPLRMVSRTADEAPIEETTVAVEGDRLTLFFPSGNSMSFQRGG